MQTDAKFWAICESECYKVFESGLKKYFSILDRKFQVISTRLMLEDLLEKSVGLLLAEPP